MRKPGRRQAGLTLLEILVSLLLISIVSLATGWIITSLGLIGGVQLSSGRHERPARLRTLAMEYVQAEMEYLRNYSYVYFRDKGSCEPSSELPEPFAASRQVPPPGAYWPNEPEVPSRFYAARIVIENESVATPAGYPSPVPPNCFPRRVTVSVYLTAADADVVPGVIFARGATVFSPR